MVCLKLSQLCSNCRIWLSIPRSRESPTNVLNISLVPDLENVQNCEHSQPLGRLVPLCYGLMVNAHIPAT